VTDVVCICADTTNGHDPTCPMEEQMLRALLVALGSQPWEEPTISHLPLRHVCPDLVAERDQLDAQLTEAREKLAKLREAWGTARCALQWVVNHADRNNDHDMSHARLALRLLKDAFGR